MWIKMENEWRVRCIRSYDTMRYGESKAINSHLFINAQTQSLLVRILYVLSLFTAAIDGDGSYCYWIHFIACLYSRFSRT